MSLSLSIRLSAIAMVFTFTFNASYAQVGVGTSTPAPSAKLEVSSTTQGFLPPRMTSTQRGSIATPANGLMVYQTDAPSGFYLYNGTAWVRMLAEGSTSLNNLTDAKSEGTDFAGSLLIGHRTTGTLSTASNNTGVGIYALSSLTSGTNNTAVGNWSLKNVTSGSRNAAFGNTTLPYLTSGTANTAIGPDVLNALTTGSSNTGIGSGALYFNVSGAGNTAVGSSSGNKTTGGYNTAIGNSALWSNTTAWYNTVVGSSAFEKSTGEKNTGLGSDAGFNTTTGAYNTYVGYQAGNVNTTGSNNTALGYQANFAANNLTNATAIGNGASVPSSNTIQLGNTSVVNVLTSGKLGLGIATPTSVIHIDKGNATSSNQQFTAGTTTGQTITDGFAIGIDASGNALLNQQENLPLMINTNNSERIRVTSAGNVGIGTASPSVRLDARATSGDAAIGVGSTTQAAATAGAGAIRYNSSLNQVEYSNGTSWTALAAGNAPVYAQFKANASQGGFVIDQTKVDFPTTVVNQGGLAIASNNTISLPAGRIYRIDLNLGFAGGTGWCRFALYNSSTGIAISETAHLESAVSGGYAAGSGTITHFINTNSGSISIDVRMKAGGCSLNDPNNGATNATLTIQAVN